MSLTSLGSARAHALGFTSREACRHECGARRRVQGTRRRVRSRLRPLATLLLLAGTLPAASKLNVMTSTEDLASIAREVGGDKINVDSIAKGYQDPHFVEPKPSFLLKLQKADLLAVVGLDLEIGWLAPLQTQRRNPNIQTAASGYLDMSQLCSILEKPTGQVTRAMGDVH